MIPSSRVVSTILADLALNHPDPEVRSEASLIYEQQHRGLVGDALRRKMRADAKIIKDALSSWSEKS